MNRILYLFLIKDSLKEIEFFLLKLQTLNKHNAGSMRIHASLLRAASNEKVENKILDMICTLLLLLLMDANNKARARKKVAVVSGVPNLA